MRARRDSTGKRWTAREDALLGVMSDERLARKLGRSAKAVKARRNLKRISFYKKWTPQEEILLGTRSDVEVGRLLARQTTVIGLRRRQLGIPAFQDRSIETKLASLTDQQIARLLRKSHLLRPTTPKMVKSRAPKWSPREDALLGQWPDERLARFLGRTTKGVQGRRQKLGIFLANPGRRWTQEEVRLLDRALIRGNAGKWTANLARKLGRSLVALKGKRRAVYGSSVNSRPWTRRELRMLGTRPDPEVAARIGRKAGTVQVRRGQLGIRSFRERNKFKWTPGKDRLLGKYSEDALAKRWGTSRQVVRMRREKLGVASSVYRDWTPEEEKLVGSMPDKEVGRRIGRSAKAVMHRRLAMKKYFRIKSVKNPPAPPFIMLDSESISCNSESQNEIFTQKR